MAHTDAPPAPDAWEIVCDEQEPADVGGLTLVARTDRFVIPGGWLYRTTVYNRDPGASSSVALVFVPAA